MEQPTTGDSGKNLHENLATTFATAAPEKDLLELEMFLSISPFLGHLWQQYFLLRIILKGAQGDDDYGTVATWEEDEQRRFLSALNNSVTPTGAGTCNQIG
jgi:hypothetical protein